MNGLSRALDRFASRRSTQGDLPRCELCGAGMTAAHAHVLQFEPRTLRCACGPCSLLFTDDGASRGRFRTVPRREITNASTRVREEEWAALGIPVGLSFVSFDSRSNRPLGFFPSPAGPVEAELKSEAWSALAADHPFVASLLPDVEALLAHRARDGAFSCFVVPIDVCYALVGEVRARWKGWSGGDGAEEAIRAFVEELRARSRPLE